MKLFLLILNLLIVQSIFAEEIPHPELLNLFEADLVVDANFKSQSSSHFYIIVNETIKDKYYGIDVGDQLKLPREDNGCGGIVDFSYYKRQRYYLKKGPNGWRLNYGSTQSIKSIYKFGSIQSDDLFCGLSLVQPNNRKRDNMNQSIREFVKTYQYIPDDQLYLALVDSVKLTALVKKNRIIAAFEKNGRYGIGDGIVETVGPETELETVPEVLSIIRCELASKNAQYPFDDEKMSIFLRENINPLSEMGVEGRVVVQVLLSDSGNVVEAEVKRGVHNMLDRLAVKKALDMPRWQPAEDQYGRKRKCYTILPFQFKIDSVHE